MSYSNTFLLPAPDGVLPPNLTSPDPYSILATWDAVGRNNADQDPSFQLQFRHTTVGAMVEK